MASIKTLNDEKFTLAETQKCVSTIPYFCKCRS